MPFKKRQLTRAEMQSDLVRAQRMRERGVNLQIPQEWSECEPLIIRTGDDHKTLAFDGKNGSAAYAIWVQLVAREPITLLDCQISSQLDDQIVLASVLEDGQFYKYGPLEFPKRQVLNTRLENGLSLGRGQVIEGTILASGLRPIPAAYRHGYHLPCTLVFYDQYGREISRPISVCADRTWKSRKVIPLSDGGLYGGTPQPQREDINEIMRLRYLEALRIEKAVAKQAKKNGARNLADQPTLTKILNKMKLTNESQQSPSSPRN
jgi:hypothetical protein